MKIIVSGSPIRESAEHTAAFTSMPFFCVCHIYQQFIQFNHKAKTKLWIEHLIVASFICKRISSLIHLPDSLGSCVLEAPLWRYILGTSTVSGGWRDGWRNRKSVTDNTSERSLSFADLIPKSQASIFTASPKNSSMGDNLPLTLPANIVAGCSFMTCLQSSSWIKLVHEDDRRTEWVLSCSKTHTSFFLSFQI